MNEIQNMLAPDYKKLRQESSSSRVGKGHIKQLDELWVWYTSSEESLSLCNLSGKLHAFASENKFDKVKCKQKNAIIIVL